MRLTQSGTGRWRAGWVTGAGALVVGLMALSGPASAGPKGTIIVHPLGNQKIAIDGDVADWPLDKFTAVAEQPVFPDGQNKDTTSASGDHLVFDPTRVGLFNGTAV